MAYVSQEMKKDLAPQIKAVLKKYGLKVNTVDEATYQRWVQKSEAVYPIVREKIVPGDVFDETKRLVDEYRRQNK